MIRIKESDIVTSPKVSEMLIRNNAPIRTATHCWHFFNGTPQLMKIEGNYYEEDFIKKVLDKIILPAWDINSLLAPAIYKGSVLMKGRKIFEVQLVDRETNELFYGCAQTMADALGICVSNSLKANNNGEDTTNSRPRNVHPHHGERRGKGARTDD